MSFSAVGSDGLLGTKAEGGVRRVHVVLGKGTELGRDSSRFHSRKPLPTQIIPVGLAG